MKKKPSQKRAGRVTHMVQLLPSKCEALSSQFKSQYCKKKKKREREKERTEPQVTRKRRHSQETWSQFVLV
jgi:hypothetical protein